MADFFVQIPFTGYISVNVEADSKEQAIEIAFERIDATDMVMKSNDSAVEAYWETNAHIVQGNVFTGMLNKANAEIL